MIITLLSSLHTITRLPPYHVSNMCYVKPLVNTMILWYTPIKHYTSLAKVKCVTILVHLCDISVICNLKQKLQGVMSWGLASIYVK